MIPRWKILVDSMSRYYPFVGAEIGVQLGRMSREVLKGTPSIKKYYAIDPFYFYNDFEKACCDIPEQYRTKIGRDQAGMDYAYEVFLQNTNKFKDKVWLLRMFSEEAAQYIYDDSLDFCFIDGNHLYEYVKRDIELYFPKVKKGGLIGGHDYAMAGTGVKQAVDEYFNQDDLFLHHDWTWWIIKRRR